ncbi:hypothetical protein SNE510_01040 [Streptomyces sp. NE5-10]|uniref:hypothetical protein n=1 Tax=Streptomyces sp. NE5-10 TaxID=2759674 RepID=UPI0019062EDE|nr:hypothetical protein [Streptomyces sp. NE5-10]GHJ90585.1 hypothetical protein SNE510_01040 [Streptomyces sp. NE5-10]
MPRIPTPALAAAGLVGGYATARWTKKRPLGGVVLAVAGGVAAREWQRVGGVGTAVGLSAAYVAAFGGSHPLAKRIGAWPAVFSVAGAMGVAAWAATRERG